MQVYRFLYSRPKCDESNHEAHYISLFYFLIKKLHIEEINMGLTGCQCTITYILDHVIVSFQNVWICDTNTFINI